jgi:hypothetical protein
LLTALNKVDFPTFGSPTIPARNAIFLEFILGAKIQFYHSYPIGFQLFKIELI